MVWLIVQFVALALVIVVAGMFLTRYADELGELTGMGRSLAGMVLLATATSLPELAVDCSAVRLDPPNPDLAVGDLLGSSLMNLLILAMLDLATTSRGSLISRQTAAHALSALMAMLLTTLALLAIVFPMRMEFLRLGPGGLAIGIAYFFGLRLVYLDQRIAKAAVADTEAKHEPKYTLRHAVIGYAASVAVILLAAPMLAHTADALAAATGLGGTFVGTTLVALTTSLPEIVTTLAALRIGAIDLAVGNILGSNTFNMAILAPVDLFYDGPLLASVSSAHAVTAGFVILATCVATMGLVYRAEKRYWIIEPDALLVLMLVATGLVCVYFASR